MYQHVEGDAKPPRELNEQIPPALDAVIRKAMAIDPQQRFNSFNELRKQLRAIARELS
jgi:serine/threonine protein kinase